MNTKKSLGSVSSLLICCWLGLSFFQSLPATAVPFEPPAREAPKRTTGGGSRDEGQCLLKTSSKTNALVSPLLPHTNLGLTLKARPTIFVYIPKTSARKAFFSLQDEENNHHHQMSVQLPSHGGVIGIQLPQDAPPLQVGKHYKWSLVTICGQTLEPDNPQVTGWVRRVTPDASLPALNSTDSLESVVQLAKKGVWYDTLSILAQLRQERPNDANLAKHWYELLTSVGLGAIATEPVVIVEDPGQRLFNAVERSWK
jgi:Domain of Unknown Function (DUF928)